MMNSTKYLIGEESILLVLPKEISKELNIVNQEWIEFEIRNKELVVKKIAGLERSLEANYIKEE
jgi:antitoxin component of MazEF toxin-antitoxin module